MQRPLCPKCPKTSIWWTEATTLSPALLMGWLSCLPQNNQEDCKSKACPLVKHDPKFTWDQHAEEMWPHNFCGITRKDKRICWETMTPNFLQDHHNRSKLCLRKQTLSVGSPWQIDLFAKRRWLQILKGSPSQIKHVFARKMDDPKICVGPWWPRAVAGWSTTAESVTETKVGGQHLPLHPNLGLQGCALCGLLGTSTALHWTAQGHNNEHLSWFIAPHSEPAASTAAVKHLSENLLVSIYLVQLATQGHVQSNPQVQATCLFVKWWIHSSMLVKWHISSKDNCYQKAAIEVHSRKREASRHVKLLISGSKRFTRTQGTPLFTGRFGWNFHRWFLMATDFGNNATMVGTLYIPVHSKPPHSIFFSNISLSVECQPSLCM